MSERAMLSIQLPREVKVQLQKVARAQRRSLSAQVCVFLESGLSRLDSFLPLGSKTPTKTPARRKAKVTA